MPEKAHEPEQPVHKHTETAIRFLEGCALDRRAAHRAHRLLMHHAHLTDFFQSGKQVFLNELKKGPAYYPRAPYFGMTTLQEQAYCEWYCMQFYEGAGLIVELGTFLGSLTKSVVDGLRANPLPLAGKRKIHVFDLFWWDSIMDSCVKGTAYEGMCERGDWFIEKYRRCIAGWIDRVEVRQADLTKFVYNQDPIEFLIVDIMKYERLCVNVLRQFFPYLLPRKGILFHQDYLHFYEAWVHVIQFLLRDYFEPLTAIDGSGAFVFGCRKEVPADLCVLRAPLKETWSDSLIEESFAWSKRIVGEENAPAVNAAHVMMYAHLERWDKAEAIYSEHAAIYAKHPSVIDLKAYFEHEFKRKLPL